MQRKDKQTPMKSAICISVIYCPDLQQKGEQGSQRTPGRALLPKHSLGLVCVLCSQPASGPLFKGFRPCLPAAEAAGAHRHPFMLPSCCSASHH